MKTNFGLLFYWSLKTDFTVHADRMSVSMAIAQMSPVPGEPSVFKTYFSIENVVNDVILIY